MNEQISSSSMFCDLVKSVIVGFHNQYNFDIYISGWTLGIWMKSVRSNTPAVLTASSKLIILVSPNPSTLSFR